MQPWKILLFDSLLKWIGFELNRDSMLKMFIKNGLALFENLKVRKNARTIFWEICSLDCSGCMVLIWFVALTVHEGLTGHWWNCIISYLCHCLIPDQFCLSVWLRECQFWSSSLIILTRCGYGTHEGLVRGAPGLMCKRMASWTIMKGYCNYAGIKKWRWRIKAKAK